MSPYPRKKTPIGLAERAASVRRAAVEALEDRRLLYAFVLYNADTNQPIGPFENNTTIDYAALPRNLSVRAYPSTGDAGSIRFGLDGNANIQTENFAPYFVKGEDSNGVPNAWTPGDGTHTFTATSYSDRNGAGAVVEQTSFMFHVGNSSSGAPVNDGPVVSFTKNTADASEAGQEIGTWVISRTGSTAAALEVAYNVAGSATNGVDNQAFTGSIFIPAGSSSVKLRVIPIDDTVVEGTEDFVVNIIPGNGYSVGANNVATCPIFDNDTVTTPPPPTPGNSQGISDITWTSNNVPRSPLERTEAGVVQVGSKIYSIGGFSAGTGSFFPLTRRVHVYDMATRQWKELASLPSQAAGNHSGVASDGRFIYVVAGQIEDTYGRGTRTSWRYDIAANKWEQFVSLPEIRFGGAAFVINGKLHFVAGNNADRETPTRDHWAIDLSNTSAGWVRKTSIPLSGDHMTHATVNGKVYVIGGEHGHHGLTAADENGYIQHNYTFEYNPANDSWARKADIPLALSHAEGQTLVINDRIVVIGGLLTGGGNNTTSRVHVYNPANNSWKLLSTRYPKRIIGGAAGYLNGKIYMVDGYSPDADDRQVGFEGTVKFG